ncbi:tyrosine-type recombinase/integrase [Vibrio crassostreae]|uniref:tyrosine-type recombinase/integrase n=1 Tax=Vibrio crassostreae TaxID=246167 RepID=UPI00104AC004|nr:site-specific integrase [Vibrio crassostreae]TCO03557.1 phage integrase family protein [Vibrio crassostreae]CAK1734348.1 Phage integrase family protein [Vibrio crassostreae]CAK1789469.1 Phage integrase family protein [Vibrio crassostreae]CAK1980067.1 Phage integrase family protein [Vibrio crassostreae]CAK2773359.1 Phage integrase family protein [Vibrio crassostreae]
MIETHYENDIYDDYRLLSIEVDTLSKLKISENINAETGEATYSLRLPPSNLKSRLKKTDIIIAPDGSVVYPQSLYLVSKLRGEAAVKDTGSIAKGLLAFTRYLDSTHYPQVDYDGNEIPPEYLTYKTLTKYEEEGSPWRFAEFLLANCRAKADATGHEAYSLSSARSYMSAVIGFYKWMQKYGYLKNDVKHVLTHFNKVEAYVDDTNQHDMLAHTRLEAKRIYEISNIMKMFPKNDQTPAHQKLKPMSLDHKELFNRHIDALPKAISLMLRLCEESGLRVNEVTHFPARNIGDRDCSELDIVPVHITHTKNSKPRTVEIPITLYEELEQFKESNQRHKNLNRRKELFDFKEERNTTDYLFVSNKGRPYTENTLEVHFGALRKSLRAIDPSWYYRIHDLRSTYATHWLWSESQERQVAYDYLMDELALLMGHSSTATTEKYIKLMNKFNDQLRVAMSKNNKINGGW